MIVRTQSGVVQTSGYVETREAADAWAKDVASELSRSGVVIVRDGAGTVHVIPLASIIDIRIEP